MIKLNEQFESLLQRIQEFSKDHPEKAILLYDRLLASHAKLLLHSVSQTESS